MNLLHRHAMALVLDSVPPLVQMAVKMVAKVAKEVAKTAVKAVVLEVAPELVQVAAGKGVHMLV